VYFKRRSKLSFDWINTRNWNKMVFNCTLIIKRSKKRGWHLHFLKWSSLFVSLLILTMTLQTLKMSLFTVSNYIPINLTMMLLLMTHDWRWRGSSSDAKTLIPSVIRYFESRNSTTEDGLVKHFQFKCKIEQESGVIIPINWLIGKIIF
jgi:hypothetical protein